MSCHSKVKKMDTQGNSNWEEIEVQNVSSNNIIIPTSTRAPIRNSLQPQYVHKSFLSCSTYSFLVDPSCLKALKFERTRTTRETHLEQLQQLLQNSSKNVYDNSQQQSEHTLFDSPLEIGKIRWAESLILKLLKVKKKKKHFNIHSNNQ